MTRAGERPQRHGAWQLDRQFARGGEPMKLAREAAGAADVGCSSPTNCLVELPAPTAPQQ
jgi:hypothetical protein